MRIAYLDCFAGIAGDMFLGALIDAGVPATVLHEATAALNLDATLKIETVDRSGISCTKVHVLEGGELAETQAHSHAAGGTSPAHAAFENQTPRAAQQMQPKTQHLHKGGHAHTHAPVLVSESEHSHGHTHDSASSHTHEAGSHAHAHGRSLTEIRALIQAAPLASAVKETAIRAFDLLGASEAKIHNVAVDEIHFHEVGAVDAIVDIVASCAGVHHLGVDAWHCSPVNLGGGMVQCAHGLFPVPAPATADLLRGLPTYSAHIQKELVTPTGAALLRALNPTFGQQPAMLVSAIGYGAGTRNPPNFPNVLRLSIGESEAATAALEPAHSDTGESPATEAVTVIETALDDLSPQVLAYVTERLLAEGALDVMLTPVIMKKGRPGTLLTVLSAPGSSEALQQLILRETSTLGLRIREDRRTCLDRSFQAVDTAYGSIRMKIGAEAGEERNAAPEFEDCRAAASRHGVPLKRVQQAALAAFLR